MNHLTFGQATGYDAAILIKTAAFSREGIKSYYIQPLQKAGVDVSRIVAFNLDYNQAGKAPASLIKDYLAEQLPVIQSSGIRYLYCADANYFKVLTKSRKAQPHLGYVLPCAIDGFEDLQVIFGINHRTVMVAPSNQEHLDLSLKTLVDALNGIPNQFGSSVIKHVSYPTTLEEIEEQLRLLLNEPFLSCDIEAFSLHHANAGIATIAFSKDTSSGVGIRCDYSPHVDPNNGFYGGFIPNESVRRLLKQFFEVYKGELRFHNAPYDTKVMIYTLWMDSLSDTKGLLKGLHLLYRNLDDTKVIAYLATNSTSKVKTSLKALAHEYSGNYAMDDEDIKDIRRIPLPTLLEYNVIDAINTNWVYDKYYPIMVQDQQLDLYKDLMMPSQKTITQVELTGMPLSEDRVSQVKAELQQLSDDAFAVIRASEYVKDCEYHLTQRSWKKDYESRKAKAKNPDKIKPKERITYPKVHFNPNSPSQLAKLFYEQLGLPVLERTPTKEPATGADVLKLLKNHTDDVAIQELIDAVIDYAGVEKILNTFISAFEKAISHGEDCVWLHGSFHLGGTVSGRLSSSNPNLQNLPAGSKYGKLIKSCFQAPTGWMMGGADFASLEDRISALQTKDPNKLKVYTDGYDGHCLRAYGYFGDHMPDIDPSSVDSINSIETQYKDFRQESKAPTFAMTYGGTYRTLMKNCGFPEDKAKSVEGKYHELYKVSDDWVADKLQLATERGYATVAFGLRIRTPVLHKTYRNNSSSPFIAEAEGRTVGNAHGQSYGLLNNRALNEFMELVWASEFAYDILPIALIHDALYFVIRDSLKAVHFINTYLPKAMSWQELDEIKHDQVKLSADFEIFYPSWKESIPLPNNAEPEEIMTLCHNALAA